MRYFLTAAIGIFLAVAANAETKKTVGGKVGCTFPVVFRQWMKATADQDPRLQQNLLDRGQCVTIPGGLDASILSEELAAGPNSMIHVRVYFSEGTVDLWTYPSAVK